MDVKNYCYSLAELAERWSCSENDILNLAIQGLPQITQDSDQCCISLLVDLSGYTDQHGRAPIMGWQQLLLPDEIARFFPNEAEAVFSLFLEPKDRNTVRKFYKNGERRGFLLNRNQIIIMGEEVRQYERENNLPKVALEENKGAVLNEGKIPIDHGQEIFSQSAAPRFSDLRNPPGSCFLTSWKSIRKHLGDVSESTARRYAKAGQWLRHSETGRPTTTTFEVDEWRRLTSSKKKW